MPTGSPLAWGRRGGGAASRCLEVPLLFRPSRPWSHPPGPRVAFPSGPCAAVTNKETRCSSQGLDRSRNQRFFPVTTAPVPLGLHLRLGGA